MNDGDDEKPVDQPFDEIRFVIPKYGATLQQSPHHGNLITNKLKALSLPFRGHGSNEVNL